jgi:hypothetical protein
MRIVLFSLLAVAVVGLWISVSRQPVEAQVPQPTREVRVQNNSGRDLQLFIWDPALNREVPLLPGSAADPDLNKPYQLDIRVGRMRAEYGDGTTATAKIRPVHGTTHFVVSFR